MEQIVDMLLLLGLFKMMSAVLDWMLMLYRSLIVKGYDLSKRYGENSWAVVTGGSTGIGAEFANQLAERGFNLILVALFMKDLKDVEAQIKLKHPNCKILLFEVDFGKTNHFGPIKQIVD